MPIKGLSEARRMPRLGKIHLGIKKDKKKDGTACAPYPSEVDYFVCPPEVQAVFGEKPKELRIMIPVEEAERFFPQYYKRYTVNLLQCKGDGEKAQCWAEDGGLKEIPCPCDFLKTGECKQIGILCFLLPDVPGFGVYQITTSSKNSIIDLNSGFDMARKICGRVRMIPLLLKREPMEIQRVDEGKTKKTTHFTLKVGIDSKASLADLQRLGQRTPETILLPPADESKDELFYPENGFKKENEDEEAKPVDEAPKAKEAPKTKTKVPTELENAGKELETLLKDYQALGGEIGPNNAKRLTELKTLAEFKKAIEVFTLRKQRLEEKRASEEAPF